ncbi:MAG: hypothetical protein SPK30_00850 [Candidatus Cryptobacteroides sp.]|nr:hypothetical protein [Bacteroidales bacterium]MDY5743196.1 hypothetical protein [Candidatus Cryptobacteroides sp.]
MEKTQKEILNDIMAELSAIRLALNSLESKLSRIDLSDPEPVELDFDEELDGDLPEEVPAEAPVEIAEEAPAEAPAEIAEEAPAEAPVKIAEEAPAEPEVELDLFGEPVLRVNEKLGAGRSRSVGEKMEQKEAWRTAMPGTAVKDVRSAISLNDRVLFIRELFGGDAGLFQKAVDDINAMGSLDEMVAYVNERHPGWDLDSDTVYRLMMAVRRKLSDN